MNANDNGHSHDDKNTVAHSHAKPIQKIIVEFDPHHGPHGQLRYHLENVDYVTALQRLELAQMFMWDDMKQAKAKAAADESV